MAVSKENLDFELGTERVKTVEKHQMRTCRQEKNLDDQGYKRLGNGLP